MNPLNWQEIFDSVGLLYVLESAPFAASIAVDEKFVWCNEAFLALVRARDRSDVIGRPNHSFLDPEYLEAARELARQVLPAGGREDAAPAAPSEG